MPDYSKNIVYLSQVQYQELITNQTITVNGVIVTYNENDIYVTPQAEPVTDVRVNGTSIAANGVANIPLASSSAYGVVKVRVGDNGLNVDNGGYLYTYPASSSDIKNGVQSYRQPATNRLHEATFYGLAKAAGADMKDIASTTVGTYPDEQKAAIQSMLGVSSLIAPSEPTLVASQAYAVGDVFTANGKLYKVTTAIAAAETIVVQNEGETVNGYNAEEVKISDEFVKKTDYADGGKPGIVQLYNAYGITKSGGYPTTLQIHPASDAELKAGTHGYRPVVPLRNHTATFYGLAKAAGDATQAASDNAVGTYTDEAKAAIKSMIGVNVDDVQTNGVSIISNGIANIPIADVNTYGVLRTGNNATGLQKDPSGYLKTYCAALSTIKSATDYYQPIVPIHQHESAFYGLAKAAGDTTQSASSNAVGTYTDSAKNAIH